MDWKNIQIQLEGKKVEITEFEYTNPFSQEIETINEEFNKWAISVYEDLLKKILKEILHREPTIEDFKKIKITPTDYFNDLILYDNIKIGHIKRKWEGYNYTLSFIPLIFVQEKKNNQK